jgi:hypothetical protein
VTEVIEGPVDLADGSRVTRLRRVDGTTFAVTVPPGAMGRGTHCQKGAHKLTPENVRWTRNRDGRQLRHCRVCERGDPPYIEPSWITDDDPQSARAFDRLLGDVLGRFAV